MAIKMTQEDFNNFYSQSKNISEFFDSLIEEDEKSEIHEQMNTSTQYFYANQKIKTKKRYYYKKSGIPDLTLANQLTLGIDPSLQYIKIEQPDTVPNSKLPHAFFTELIIDKIDYLLGKKPSVRADQIDQKMYDLISDLVNNDFFYLRIRALSKYASVRGREYFYIRINEEGKFKPVVFDSRQCIVVAKNMFDWEEIQEVVRYYKEEWYSSSENQNIILYRIEWYSSEGVEYYIGREERGKRNFVASSKSDEKPQLLEKGRMKPIPYGGDNGNIWASKLPILELPNNESELSDLYTRGIKELIDAYDFIKSVEVDSLIELIDSLLVIKGARGVDANELRQNLAYFKILMTHEQGGVDSISQQFETEARKFSLDNLAKNIVRFGRGVWKDENIIGASPSGVALKFLYNMLDQKSTELQRYLELLLKETFWFYLRFLNFKIPLENYMEITKGIEIIPNKSMIVNENEIIEGVIKAAPYLSKETILSNLPMVTNVAEEMERLEQEEAERIEAFEQFATEPENLEDEEQD